jgi:hypothetical protein
MTTVVARLRLPDGREFDVNTDCKEEHADVQHFRWTEGNGSCDCNKVLFLNQQHDLNLNDDIPCGDTIELVSLKVGGKEVL